MGQLECSFQRNDGQHQSQPHKIKGNNAQGLFSKPIFDLEANDCGIGAGFGKLNQGINWRITKEKGLLEAKDVDNRKKCMCRTRKGYVDARRRQSL